MRISDWSSDVCSSDLPEIRQQAREPDATEQRRAQRLAESPCPYDIVPDASDSPMRHIFLPAHCPPDGCLAPTEMATRSFRASRMAGATARPGRPVPALRPDGLDYDRGGRYGSAMTNTVHIIGGGLAGSEAAWQDRKSTRLNSSHSCATRMPASA